MSTSSASAAARNGSHTSTPGTGIQKSAGMTPTTSRGAASRASVRPTTFGSLSKRSRQSVSLMMTATLRWKSASLNGRPSRGRRPASSK